MRTIQITIDEELLNDVDRTVDELGANRSAFIRGALQAALHRHRVQKLETQDAGGYAQQPQRRDEVTEWLDEQVWDEP